MSVDIKLDRVDRIYHPGDKVSGAVVISSQGSMRVGAIKLVAEGTVECQLSARSIGLFEAFYSTLKPVELLNLEIDLSSGTKVPNGETEFPFEFVLEPLDGQELADTYHGVYVNTQYRLTVDIARGFASKNLKKVKEFVVEMATDKERQAVEKAAKPFNFKVSPESLRNVKSNNKSKIPQFLFEGFIDNCACQITRPFTGEIIVKKSEIEIKSIELQLVRVETISYMEGEAREATEIQNIQIADGDVVRGLSIPIHMVFPRLFTCSSVKQKGFQVQFEVNLITVFADNHTVTENFPIQLYR
jgi:hypothetical protein